MSIQSLPPNTIRAIGSSQVLTDPASLVKELIDNAIDARATNISVEISLNTLDIIQVRDSGHGIAPADRQLVCKRYCTSKLRDYAELKSIGGKSLGFRGEALASAAELSGGISITTRVEGEEVAVCLKVGQNGALQSEERASHPIGTTVRVVDFFKALPVRKQTALKIAAKCLAKIKRQMQAYALARPSVRLALKVLKAKNEKANWVYAPKPGAGVEDAAFKVVGSACASQCIWSIIESEGFVVEAFLPKPNGEMQKVSNIGHFVSVDSRPVSTARGTLNQIVKLFKERLKDILYGSEVVKDPFLYLNIVCPSESYDANVEPAKDDVLFEDNAKVLRSVEKLLDACYAKPNKHDPTNDNSTESHLPSSIQLPGDEIVFEQPYPERHRLIRNTMYGCEDDDFEDMAEPTREFATGDEKENADIRKDITISNPWAIAKMHAPLRRSEPISSGNAQLITPLRQRTSAEQNAIWPAPSPVYPEATENALPTPQPSSSPGPKNTNGKDYLIHARGSDRDAVPQTYQEISTGYNKVIGDHQEPALLNTGPTYQHPINDFVSARELPLDTSPYAASYGTPYVGAGCVYQNNESMATMDVNRAEHRPDLFSATPASPLEPHSQTMLEPQMGHFASLPRSDRPRYHMPEGSSEVRVSDTQSSIAGTPLSLIPEAPRQRRAMPPRKRQSNNVNKPFVSPVNDPTVTWFQHLPSSRRAPAPQRQSQEGDIRSFLDNGRRRPAHRTRVDHNADDGDMGRASEELSPTTHPEADIGNPHDETIHEDIVLAHKNAQAQFSRPRRSKSARLPLERVPDGWYVQNCVRIVSTNLESIKDQLLKVGHDRQREYAYEGVAFPEESAILHASPPDLEVWTNRLNSLLGKRYSAERGIPVSVEDVKIGLERLKGALMGSSHGSSIS